MGSFSGSAAAIASVASTSSCVLPGSKAECPASATMRKSASGQARCRSQALRRGTDHVVAPLDDRRRNVADARHVVEQLALAAQEAAIDEIMALDARQRQRELVLAPLADVVGVARRKLVAASHTDQARAAAMRCALIAAGQPLVVRAQEVVALIGRDRVAIGLPAVRERSPTRRAGRTSGFRRSAAGRCRAAPAR